MISFWDKVKRMVFDSKKFSLNPKYGMNIDFKRLSEYNSNVVVLEDYP